MRFSRLWAAVFAVALSGCLPVTTKTPVGTTAGLGGDPALIGVWRVEEKKAESGYIAFLKNGDGTLTAIVNGDDKSGPDVWQRFQIKTATLAGHNFINAREIEVGGKTADDSLAGEIIPIRYEILRNRLALYLFDEKKTADAIKAGALAGTVEPGDFGDVHVTADGASLDAFMQAAAGLKLSEGEPTLVLRRIF